MLMLRKLATQFNCRCLFWLHFGTFINSFNDRCYVAAVHRSIYRTGTKDGFSTDLGYNLGVVKGHDSRLISIANDVKYLPFLQVTYDISWKMLGLQLLRWYCTYSWFFH